ncbi:hydrolase Nlp/P60 [bacterium]|nr:hydrolase Nlp/P60 [bacterium]
MVDQLLFGERFEVRAVEGDWLRIAARKEAYEGWMPADLGLLTTADDPGPRFVHSGFLGMLEREGDALPINVTMGAELPHFKPDTHIGHLEGHPYFFNGDFEPFETRSTAFAAEAALDFLHAPYLWGGRSIWGIDCSGLVQVAFKRAGRDLPRDAFQQAELGTVLGFVDEAEPGDLAFFHNPEGRIVHVGLLLGDHRIVHASGRVRIDRIDQTGIFNAELNRHTHALRFLKRLA